MLDVNSLLISEPTAASKTLAAARNHYQEKLAGSPHQERPRTEMLARLSVQPPAVSNVNSSSIAKDFIILDEPYSPCVKNLDTLKPIVLSELVVDSHHRGRFLLAKLFGAIELGRSSAHAGIEDTDGSVEILKVPFVCMNMVVGHSWPPTGQWLIIKEPFMTFDTIKNGNPCVEVNHPSDLLEAGHLPKVMLDTLNVSRFLPDTGNNTPLQCKEAGNAALKAKNFQQSHDRYTEGLQLITNQGVPSEQAQAIMEDLLRNRSYTRLELGRYEGAVADVIASICSEPGNSDRDIKAYFRAAKSSYKLKSFGNAAAYCEKLLELMPTEQDGKSLLVKTKDRIREQNEGKYNLAAMQEVLSTQSARVNAADYTSATTVKPSGPGRGRGLFATRDLKPGELVMAETAFCSVWSGEPTHLKAVTWNARLPDKVEIGPSGLWKQVCLKVRDNPSLGKDLLDLHGDYQGIGKTVLEVDGVPVIDTYQIHDIVMRNTFELGSNETGELSSGVYIRSSYFNHSCTPNCERIARGDLLLFHANKPIFKGEELTIVYYDNALDGFEAHTDKLQTHWSFRCQCPLCLAEAKVAKADLARRDQLLKDVDAFMQHSSSYDTTTHIKVAEAEELAQSIGATYDKELYCALPRKALIPIQIWLLNVYHGCNNLSECARLVSELLCTLGYKVDTRDSATIKHVQPTANGILPYHAAGALWEHLVRQAATAHDSGDKEVAEHLSDFARQVEYIGNGTDTETLEGLRKLAKSDPSGGLAAMHHE